MKHLSKLILITLQLSLSAFGAQGGNEEPRTPRKDKAALSITAFTLKSSDGKLEMKMDRQGQIFVHGQHVATANAKGEVNTPAGKLIMRINENGGLEPDVMGAPVKITRDGTLTGAGEAHSWVEGKFKVGDKGHLEITPKDSPSKQAATLMFVMASVQRVVEQPK
ncbi:MAG: hypothetical protein B9S38_05735 [Verrucomicrobiia bacterium Tous-C4TDCM]|nr:MAG: hypothetical protein B9S38_05735 [Verrucomicrobiae bacterium Tous-C4TDCM]